MSCHAVLIKDDSLEPVMGATRCAPWAKVAAPQVGRDHDKPVPGFRGRRRLRPCRAREVRWREGKFTPPSSHRGRLLKTEQPVTRVGPPHPPSFGPEAFDLCTSRVSKGVARKTRAPPRASTGRVRRKFSGRRRSRRPPPTPPTPPSGERYQRLLRSSADLSRGVGRYSRRRRPRGSTFRCRMGRVSAPTRGPEGEQARRCRRRRPAVVVETRRFLDARSTVFGARRGHVKTPPRWRGNLVPQRGGPVATADAAGRDPAGVVMPGLLQSKGRGHAFSHTRAIGARS